ncbi:hypothetical protein KIPB_011601, partial [Kipferlia bialata]|eukprot:g11601.t1
MRSTYSSGNTRYITAEQIKEGQRNGTLYTGRVRMASVSAARGYLQPEGVEGNPMIYIESLPHLNRCMHGDTVAVELLPQAEWHNAARGSQRRDREKGRWSFYGRSLDEEKANEDEKLSALMEQATMIPTGRVVAILKADHPTEFTGVLKDT